MIIYIVSSRYGIGINEPTCFKTKSEAIDYIKESLVDDITETDKDAALFYYDHNEDIEATLAYAKQHELCSSYNNILDDEGNIILDTCESGDEWSEYMLSVLDTNDL